MRTTRKHNGPWVHRLLVYSFTAAFGLLVYWLQYLGSRQLQV